MKNRQHAFTDLVNDYSKDKLTLLNSTFEKACLIYSSGNICEALLSLRFIQNECDSLLCTIGQEFFMSLSLLLSGVRDAIIECESLLE
ncbi:hypothetical protein G3G77_004768 [Salmonella enterica]|nr:hypothetical protein [Salmonella enterica]EEH5466700.1 hypothetical protein [Salmonella enterica]EEH7556020.1 hypothetical protein [Salmonella enterica]EEO5640217.1 hypothetical protein [Salmonella enterica]EEQ0204189.1 hypothetical protein [Salmonella enterica]